MFRDDQTYPFRVEPYFKAWVPLTQAPGSFLRLVPGQRPMLVYKQVDDYWHEPPSDPEGYWTQHFDIRIAQTDAEARKLSGSGARWVAIGSAAERVVRGGGTATQPAINDPRFLNHLDFSRAVKTTYELLCMRGAQAMAVRGHLAVAEAFKAGATELELHQAYLAASGQRETELPYGNIIGLNEHAATLHYQRHARRGADGQPLAADRRRRRVQRLRGGHHAHLFRVGDRRFRGADRVDGLAPAAHLRGSEARRRLRRVARVHAPPARCRAARATSS